MPFGRHRGEPLSALPDSYLWWLASLPNLRPPLRGAVLAEIGRRVAGAYAGPAEGAPSREVVEELVGAGFRALTRKYHPDVGGETRRMQQVNAAADWLRRIAGVRR